MVGEAAVLLGIQHLQQGRGRITAPIGPQLVDLVEEEQWVGRLRFLHPLDDLARHRSDVGPAMATHLRLVAHTTKRHANEVTTRRLGD